MSFYYYTHKGYVCILLLVAFRLPLDHVSCFYSYKVRTISSGVIRETPFGLMLIHQRSMLTVVTLVVCVFFVKIINESVIKVPPSLARRMISRRGLEEWTTLTRHIDPHHKLRNYVSNYNNLSFINNNYYWESVVKYNYTWYFIINI